VNDPDDDELPAIVPVSPSTGLDPEIRQFVGRVMQGYESAHRTVATLCETLSLRAEKAEAMVARSLELQLKLAEEREELISRRHRRELEAEAAKQRQESFGAVSRDFRALMLLLGKRFAGIPLSGNDSHGLQDLLGTITPDQVEVAMTSGTLTLSPAQRHMLAATLSSIASAEVKNETEAGKAGLLPEAAE